eukprot:TRINITY_DN38167_c0_g1_i1.p1 TRINITY_DN38167_c0_g1~~TRINITY_DN38167_c0_g1_i1.p1  ORF type:complete len:270 (+),score=72.08 TRINITY_DN38167_c0_g1_i1:85-894(+)
MNIARPLRSARWLQRWCSSKSNDTGTKEEEVWPLEVPMQGQQLKRWMNATGFDYAGFFNGVIQAYGAVAHVNAKETGDEKWVNLPVDEEARLKLENNKDKTDPFNNCSLAMRIAHPEDQLLTVAIKSFTLKDDGEQLALVKIWVASFPEALFGEDVGIAEKLFKQQVKGDDSHRYLGTRFLESLYSLYFDNDQLPAPVRNKAIESWEEYRESWRVGHDGYAVPVPWIFQKFLERQPNPKRLKEWIFRKDLEGNWNLFDMKVLSSRVTDG